MKKYNLNLNEEEINNIKEISKRLSYESDFIYADRIEKIILDKVKEIKEKEEEEENNPVKEYK